MNKGWVYAISALVHFVFFFSLPPPKYIFSVCIKCQVNFLGAMRDVSSPFGMCGRVVDCGRVVCVCVSDMCACVSVCMGEWGKGHGKAKREARGGGGGGVQYSTYKLALSEELERCVESAPAPVCVCV